jgi:hypothetical protein
MEKFGSGNRDPDEINLDQGSGINIPDPQHCNSRYRTASLERYRNLSTHLTLMASLCSVSICLSYSAHMLRMSSSWSSLLCGLRGGTSPPASAHFGGRGGGGGDEDFCKENPMICRYVDEGVIGSGTIWGFS